MKKATFNKDQFLKILFTVTPYISGKNTLPILDNVLLQKTKEGVSMTVSDLETTIICNLPTINGDVFEFVFDGKQVMEILKMSSDPAFDLIVDEDEVIGEKETTLVPIKMTLELLNGNVVFPVMNADEFPKLPVIENEIKGILPAKIIKRKDTWANFCGHDELRPVMSGVNIEITSDDNGKFMYSVATNANILFVEKMKTDNDPMNIILPPRLTQLLEKIVKDEDLVFYYNDRNVRIVKNGITIISRLIDGKYPGWRNVVPVNKFYFEIDRVQTINTINKALVTANATTGSVTMVMKDRELIIESQDIDLSKQSKYTIPVNIYGPNLSIGISGHNFIKCLKQFSSGLVRIEYSKHNRAMLIKGAEEKGILALAMPLMSNVNDAEEEAIIKAWEEANLESVITPTEVVEATAELVPEAADAPVPYAEAVIEGVEADIEEAPEDDDELPDPDPEVEL